MPHIVHVKMASVPTWTELRSDAIKLSRLQRECYTSVHQLLDNAIPELDRKISILNGYPTTATNTVTRASAQPKVLTTIHIKSKAPQAKISHHRPVHVQKKPRRPSIKERQPTSNPSKSSINYKSSTPKPNSPVRPSLTIDNSDDQALDQLEHLKPPPLPLSEYFRRNRPDLIMRAESRAMYLRKKAERRKYISSTKIINCLEQIRLSSRCSSTYQSLNSRQTKLSARDNYTPSSYQVRCKLSEHEMKRLTARTYKRLPEVKRKRKEELTTHMKVQNYKNKLEYGRKLLENRRNGIIDYPLRSSYDDRSITSSQSDFSMNGYGRAADAFKADPYY